MSTDGFFEPGVTYELDDPERAESKRPRFKCMTVQPNPGSGQPTALGFWNGSVREGWDGIGLRAKDWARGWTVFDDGAAE